MEPTSNRTALLRVALDLFASRGYDATGVKEIVETVGVSKPTLYHYFGTKRGLLDALLEAEAEGFLRDLAGATAYAGDLPATLQRVVALYLTFAAERPTFYRFLLSLLFTPPENEVHTAAERIFGAQRRLLEELFVVAARDHGNMRGRHERYAYALLGILTSYAVLVLDGHLVPNTQLVYQVAHQFSHGIYS